MSSFVEFCYPAGEESDASNDEWDLGFQPSKKSPSTEDVKPVVSETEDDVSLMKRAINKGDTETVELLLNKGMDVETRLDFDWSPLMYAVSLGNSDVAKLLLDKGASANFSKDNLTVLMASCTASASEDKIAGCVGLLLSRNADPNMVDRFHTTCLMQAARYGLSKVVNLLVSHGAKINIQDNKGYTALSTAVQYNREEAVLKLLQLGADKTIRINDGRSPANLAEHFKYTQISKILACSSHVSTAEAFSSMKETLSKLFTTNSESPSSNENMTKLQDLELLLHGLNLGYLTDIMAENDITWSHLLSMEKEDLEKIGVTDQEDQQKVLGALQQMQLDKVDLETIGQLRATDSGSEDLQNFLISVSQQCCYLTETIQDVIGRFPRQASQLVFSLDPQKEAQSVCLQLMVQTKDLHQETCCLYKLLSQMEEAKDCCQLPDTRSHRSWRSRILLSTLGLSCLLLLYKATSRKIHLQLHRNLF